MTAMIVYFLLGCIAGANLSLIAYGVIAAGHCHACEARRDRWERIHWFAA
jgi:hypothetical protein